MRNKVGDKTFTAAQLQRCAGALGMKNSLDGPVMDFAAHRDCDGKIRWSCTITMQLFEFFAEDRLSPFKALCGAIETDSDFFKAHDVEVLLGR